MVFASLPAEILSQIVSYLDIASDVGHLSQTCRKLHEHVQTEGWKSFIRANFHAVAPTIRWADAAHSLSTLSRNIDQLSLLARPVAAPHGSTDHDRPQHINISRQTMGYQPMIDASEEFSGSSWHSRYETLVWSTGASVVARVTKKGPPTRSRRKSNSAPKSDSWSKIPRADAWTTCYRDDGLLDGRDDVTALRLLPSQNRSSPNPWSFSVICGRASGILERVSMGNEGNAVGAFQTDSLPVYAIDVSSSRQPQLVACLAKSLVRIYEAAGKGSIIKPVTEVNVSSNSLEPKRVYRARFLSETTFAIGRGNDSEIVSVYTMRPTGLEKTAAFNSGIRSDGTHKTSTFALAKLRWSGDEASCESNVFLSGSFDGRVRLHDVRSPKPFESLFYNGIDRFAIYSIQAIDRYRFAAGAGANRLLNIFDLRVSGTPELSTQISTMSIESTSRKRPVAHAHIFLNQPKRAGRDYPNRKFSPIYSLASPSASSASLYVGTEGLVTQIDLTDVTDSHPDPASTSVSHTPRSKGQRGRFYEASDREVLNLGMYDGDFDHRVSLKMQRDVGVRGVAIPGYDQRWEVVARPVQI